VTDINLGQWTAQAQDLYDLLILTFSNGKNSLTDLAELQKASGLNATEWEDLLQYTSQVRRAINASLIEALTNR